METSLPASEIDTVSIVWDGVPPLPPFLKPKNGKVFDRYQETQLPDGSKSQSTTTALETDRAFYIYDIEKHSLRMDTSRPRCGDLITCNPPFFNPDFFLPDYTAYRLLRVDECITLPLNLRGFARLYQGPPRSRMVHFGKTGTVWQLPNFRLRIYDKVAQNRSKKKNIDQRYLSGTWWRIEVSYVGKRRLAKTDYGIPVVPTFPPELLAAYKAALVFLSSRNVIDSPSMTAWARFAYRQKPELWKFFKDHAPHTKNIRRLEKSLMRDQ